jgi:glycosyltransferase involved in cell wall biosynthesis
MMKIVHVYKDYAPVLGGIENHLRWQAEGMRARGHDVHVLVTNVANRTVVETIDGVPVTKCARQLNISSAPLAAEMPLALRRLAGDADIVHLHAPYPPGELAQLFMRAGRRTVVTYHSDIVKQATLLKFYAPFLRRILHHADKILVSNPPYIASSPFLAPISAAQPGKIEVVHFGIDLERFAATPAVTARAAELRTQFGPGPLVLFVGRLRYYKGVSVLVSAMAQVTGARCLIVGTGPEEEAVRGLIADLGVGDRVQLSGTLSDADLPAAYQAADLFVLPSIHRSESLGIVLLEAMASGRPLISTELGTGTSYVNRHEETGLVVAADDPAALAAAIQRLVDDGDLRQRYGAAALAHAQATFGLDAMLDATEHIYRTLTNAL